MAKILIKFLEMKKILEAEVKVDILEEDIDLVSSQSGVSKDDAKKTLKKQKEI